MRDYSEIPGWFNEEWLYDRMIGHVRDGATFVEVGVLARARPIAHGGSSRAARRFDSLPSIPGKARRASRT